MCGASAADIGFRPQGVGIDDTVIGGIGPGYRSSK